jgi:hypothetical protein
MTSWLVLKSAHKVAGFEAPGEISGIVSIRAATAIILLATFANAESEGSLADKLSE